jgi:hypothetical protein
MQNHGRQRDQLRNNCNGGSAVYAKHWLDTEDQLQAVPPLNVIIVGRCSLHRTCTAATIYIL